MEYKKKKNDDPQSQRNALILIAIFLLLVWMIGFVLFLQRPFSQTATPLLSTNPVVITLIVQTSVAGTEQFLLTSTALP